MIDRNKLLHNFYFYLNMEKKLLKQILTFSSLLTLDKSIFNNFGCLVKGKSGFY